MEIRKETIEVEVLRVGGTACYKKAVQADVFGQLAIHSTIGSVRCLAPWTVSHIPTGCVVAKALEYGVVMKFVERVFAAKLDWGFSEPNKMPEETRMAMMRIRSEMGVDPHWYQ